MNKKLLRDGFLKILSVEVPKEAKTTLKVAEYMDRGDAVAILIVNLDHTFAVMCTQFRVGSYVSEGVLFNTSLPAGMLDKGETPDEAAIREAKEETGLDINILFTSKPMYSSIGGTTERITMVLAEANFNPCDKLKSLDEGEGISLSIEAVEYLEYLRDIAPTNNMQMQLLLHTLLPKLKNSRVNYETL